MELARSYRLGLRLRAKARVDQAMIEALCLSRRFQLYRIFGNAGCPEVVRHAANGDHQRIVADRACRRDLTSFVVDGSAEMNLLAGAVQADHFAVLITKAVPVRLGEI